MSIQRSFVIGLRATSLDTDNAEPIDGVRVAFWVDWDRQPVSVHGDDREELEGLIRHLKSQHNLRKRSLVMDDRENGGFLFFLYQSCDPRWITEYLNQGQG